MLKKILGLAFLVSDFWLLVTLVYAADETLTITTYYPSPYGSYREVSAYRMKVGTDYSDAAYSVSDNNLIVQGNVGIGTASPTPIEKLVQTGNIRMRSADSRIIALNSDFGYSLGSSGGAAIRFIADGANDEIAFETHKTGVSHAERVRINSLGNVSIGTASPNYKTEISEGWLRVRGTGQGGDPAMRIGVYDTDNTGGISGWWFSQNNDGKLAIHQDAVGDRLNIDGSGNVGIGTASPGNFKLYVAGKARADTPLATDPDETVATKGYVDAQQGFSYISICVEGMDAGNAYPFVEYPGCPPGWTVDTQLISSGPQNSAGYRVPFTCSVCRK